MVDIMFYNGLYGSSLATCGVVHGLTLMLHGVDSILIFRVCQKRNP